MSFICNTSLYAFRNKLLCIFLEITIFTAVLHSSNRSHTTVYFIFTSLIQFKSSRALIASCEDTSHHTYICTSCNCLGNVSGIFDTTVCNDRDSITISNLITIHYCSNLWYTNTCNHTCGTNRSKSDTNLNCVNTSLYQSLGGSSCGNVSCNYLKIRICSFNFTDSLQNIL